MNFDITTLKNKFGKNLKIKENLSKYSWFNLGGPAEVFFRPENIDQLKEFLIFNNNKNNKINIIGAGSNTLIRDRGVEGIVIKLSPNFSNIELLEHNIIEVGAATLDRKLSDFAKNSYEPVIAFAGRTECLSINPLENDQELGELLRLYS